MAADPRAKHAPSARTGWVERAARETAGHGREHFVSCLYTNGASLAPLRALATLSLINVLLIVAPTHANTTAPSATAIGAAYASGRFQDAWASFVGAMRLDQKEIREGLMHCIEAKKCPSAWQLAAVASLSADEASFITSFCEVNRAYCAHLGLPEEASLLVRAVDNQIAVIPLASGVQVNRNVYANLRPRVKLTLGDDHESRALLDTGTTNNMVFSENAIATVTRLGQLMTEAVIRTGRDVVTHGHSFVLPHMTLGALRHRAVPIVLDDPEVKTSSITNMDTVGMATILRHGAVCFSWVESLLYLGDLGPCEVGYPPYGGSFGVGLSLRIELRQDGQVPTWGIVDTGADHSPCPYGASIAEYQFGADEMMRLSCHGDDVHSIIVGMDTLVKFAGFGWELNPLRLYFVPLVERQW